MKLLILIDLQSQGDYMWCIFHKWEIIKTNKIKLKSTFIFGGTISGVGEAVLERCSKCNEERAYFTDGDTRTYKDAEFIKRNFLND